MPKPLELRLRNREYDARRGSSRERGYTTEWNKAAAAYKLANPLCVMCLKVGRVEPARVVDHIIPHKGDAVLFWDQDNWQSLCKPHHDSDKQRIERGGKPRAHIGIDGWPIE